FRALELPFITGFRNTYKGGPAVLVGLAVLASLAVWGFARQAQRRWRRGEALVYGIAAIVVVVGSLPAWVGNLYSPDGNRGVPQYWHQAAAWLDSHPGDDRVWVSPGSGNAYFRWGYVGDDLVDSLVRRPHVDRAIL